MPDPETTLWKERKLLIIVALGGTLAPLNSTMIAMALPRIMADFKVGLDLGGRLVTGYLIVMASLQPIGGKLGDRIGQSWGMAIDRTGVVMMAMMGTMAICAPIGGRLADRWGRRWPPVGGLNVLIFGVLFLGFNAADGNISQSILAVGLAIIGMGIGLSSTGLQTSAVESVGPKEAGVAAGLYSTSRYLGSIVGSSLLASLLGSGADGGERIFWMIFAASICAVLVSLGLEDRPGDNV